MSTRKENRCRRSRLVLKKQQIYFWIVLGLKLDCCEHDIDILLYIYKKVALNFSFALITGETLKVSA